MEKNGRSNYRQTLQFYNYLCSTIRLNFVFKFGCWRFLKTQLCDALSIRWIYQLAKRSLTSYYQGSTYSNHDCPLFSVETTWYKYLPIWYLLTYLNSSGKFLFCFWLVLKHVRTYVKWGSTARSQFNTHVVLRAICLEPYLCHHWHPSGKASLLTMWHFSIFDYLKIHETRTLSRNYLVHGYEGKNYSQIVRDQWH